MHAAPRMNALIASLSTVLPLAGVGAAVYMHQQNIPFVQAAGIIAAFLMEGALFLATGSLAARARLAAWNPVRLAFALTGFTTFTWLLAGGGELWEMAATTAIAGFLAFWYLRFPRLDVPLLLVYGAAALGKLSVLLYFVPWPKAPTPIIGELAWLRTLLFAVLLFRQPVVEPFGFFPTRQEWKEGLRWFVLLLPAVMAVGIPIGFVKVRDFPTEPARLALAIVGTFLGHFIFVALREEILFRALLLTNFQKWFGAAAGLAASCVIFGSVHVLAGEFPNWRFATVAAAAGFFYAKSYLATGSVRSAMVTHALTNVVAKVFLST